MMTTTTMKTTTKMKTTTTSTKTMTTTTKPTMKTTKTMTNDETTTTDEEDNVNVFDDDCGVASGNSGKDPLTSGSSSFVSSNPINVKELQKMHPRLKAHIMKKHHPTEKCPSFLYIFQNC